MQSSNKIFSALLWISSIVVVVNSAGYGGLKHRTQPPPPSRASYSESVDEYESPVEMDTVPQRVSSSYVKQSTDDYSRTPARDMSGSYGYSKQDNDKIFEEQAKSAKYAFASAVDDGIMDQSQVRQEVRDGLKVSGSYSYSDGFYKRTVKYEADENGYRVVGEDTEPIGGGPQIDLENGKADVHTQVEGVDTQYSISAYDINTMGGRDTVNANANKKLTPSTRVSASSYEN